MNLSAYRQAFIDNDSKLVAVAGPVLRAGDAQLLADAARLVSQSAEEMDVDTRNRLKWGGRGAFRIPEKLAVGYLATQDTRYVDAAVRWLTYRIAVDRLTSDDWTRPNDGCELAHGLGATEVPGWLGSLSALLANEAFPDTLFSDIMLVAQTQINYLLRHQDPATHNIRMLHLDLFLTSSLRLAFLDDAQQWQLAAIKGLNDMFYRLFEDDGSSIESTGWYHYIVANIAERVWRIQQEWPDMKLELSTEQVARAFDYVAACIEPCGHFNRVGDCTAAIYPFADLADFLARRHEVFARLGLANDALPTRQVFGDTGQAVIRSDWTAAATCLTFDATTHVAPAWHWHPACNSVNLSVDGVRMLVDPGRLHYDPTPQRNYALSTRAHNTITINDWNQTHTRGLRLKHNGSAGIDVLESQYTGGYATGGKCTDRDRYRIIESLNADHHRTVLWLHGHYFLVLDHVANYLEAPVTQSTIAATWQCSPGPVELDGRQALMQRDGASLRMVFALCPDDSALSVHEGEQDPVRGWIADDKDEPIPAPQVRLATKSASPSFTALATLLIPGKNEVPTVEVLDAQAPAWFVPGRLRLRWNDGRIDRFYWHRCLANALWEIDDFETDASLVYISESADGELRQAAIHGGSYLSPWQAPFERSRGTFMIHSGSDE